MKLHSPNRSSTIPQINNAFTPRAPHTAHRRHHHRRKYNVVSGNIPHRVATVEALSASPTRTTTADTLPETSDFVIIGSGIGGLCCAALLVKYGYSVTVCEAHYHAGGAAHGFDHRAGYHFDAGPSFFAGMSLPKSSNPLRQVLDAIGESTSIQYKTYDKWMVYGPGEDPNLNSFPCVCDANEYANIIRRVGGEIAHREWTALEQAMRPLGEGAALFPAAALRADPGIILSASRFGPDLLKTAFMANQLTAPFSNIVDRYVTPGSWLRKFIDLECFVLSGMLAKDTIAAEMVYMYVERNGGRSTIDYPMGGSSAIVDALVRGICKYNGGSGSGSGGRGAVVLNCPVQQILVEAGEGGGASTPSFMDGIMGRKTQKATGVVVTHKGKTKTLKARKAVISNASIWDTVNLLLQTETECSALQAEAEATPRCGSFMHLHLGIDATDLPTTDIHHLFVNSWDDIEAPRNICIASIPSILDPSLAPPGKAVVHAYTAGNEPWDGEGGWGSVTYASPEYEALKIERSECLFKSLEKVIPDIRERTEVCLIGTPHTHARFLRRYKGTYGPAISAATGSFPGPSVAGVEGLYRCGDSCAPGIGVPAAAASAMIAANSLVPVWSHLQLLDELGF